MTPNYFATLWSTAPNRPSASSWNAISRSCSEPPTGRLVFGQFKYNSSSRRQEARQAFDARPDVRAARLNERNHISLVDESGHASFDAVEPGEYVLELKLYPGKSLTQVPGHRNTDEPRTLLTQKVVIPDRADGDRSTTLSLGELAVGN